MSKRHAFPQCGSGKKPKLDISRSDHHIPLSQSISCSNDKAEHLDVWGDDDEEQMLLQASQACEEQTNDVSILPDYSIWKQPGSTSTQYQPSSSYSKPSFEFKKPRMNLPMSVTTQLRNKCNTISSPLPGISTMSRDRHSNPNENLTDKIVSGQEEDIRWRMLQLEEENSKLKSEFGRLSDKIVTKEGEATILRSQLKAAQLANENVCMEKIRVQERVQMECNEKLVAINKDKEDLKTQLEYKDLEIMRVQDRLKRLEAKMKLTQANDISRNNNNLVAPYDAMTQHKRPKMSSSGMQTENKPFLKLNKSCGKVVSQAGQRCALSEVPFNKKVTFDRTNLLPNKLEIQKNAQLELFDRVRNDLCALEAELGQSAPPERGAPPEMVLNVPYTRLFETSPLYKDERGTEARCQTASLSAAIQPEHAARRFFSAELKVAREHGPTILDTAIRICTLVGKTKTSIFYSGLLMALIQTFDSVLCASDVLKPKIFDLTKAILLSKPMPFVIMELLTFVRRISSMNDFLSSFCPANGSDGMDVENTEPCYFVELLKQTDEALALAHARRCGHSSLHALRNILAIFEFVNDKYRTDANRCECQRRAPHTLLRALRGGAALAADRSTARASWHQPLQSVSRSAVKAVHKCACADAEWLARVTNGEGLLSDAVFWVQEWDPHMTELTELRNTFQAAPEDASISYLQSPFMTSFESFSMTD